MFGKTHTPESRTQMCINQQLVDRSGENNPMFGRTGALHPRYGKVPTNAKTIYIYSLEYVLVETFSSMTAAANFLNTSTVQVHRYVRSGKVFQSKYLISTTILSN